MNETAGMARDPERRPHRVTGGLARFASPVAFAAGLLLAAAAPASAQARDDALLARAEAERPAVVETLRKLVEIESGSRDTAGLARLADLLEAELRQLGAATERVPGGPSLGANVVGRLEGTGTGSVLLIAHTDTVFPQGILKTRPFRVDGDRAYGPGVADAKGGVAVILHSLKILKERGYRDFARITVLFNPDEEIGSPGSGELIRRLAGEHDATLSFEPTSSPTEVMVLGTAGVADVSVRIKGKAAHAGVNPEAGVNAIVELSDLVLRTQDLDDPKKPLRFNWTVASVGGTRNVIPDSASVSANVRYARNEDLDALVEELKRRMAQKRLAGAELTLQVQRGRPAYFADAASRRLADKAKALYAEAGGTLQFVPFTGGGTDAGYAALSGKPVIENLALPGFGYHSPAEEFVDLARVGPRLYMTTRLIMDVTQRR
jgi:glutamate carboxypeptidase